MIICLLGYMGSGKSTLGRMLASATNRDFVDFDDYIERREGTSIPEIFEAVTKFREVDEQRILDVTLELKIDGLSINLFYLVNYNFLIFQK